MGAGWQGRVGCRRTNAGDLGEDRTDGGRVKEEERKGLWWVRAAEMAQELK